MRPEGESLPGSGPPTRGWTRLRRGLRGVSERTGRPHAGSRGGSGSAGRLERTMSEETHDQARRRQHQVVDNAHEDGCRNLGDRYGEGHPPVVYGAHPTGNHQAPNHQRAPQRSQDQGWDLVPSPQADGRDDPESGSDREAETPTFLGGQSSSNSSRQSPSSCHSGCRVLSSMNGQRTR